jgi:non-heme chloroperoxidase
MRRILNAGGVAVLWIVGVMTCAGISSAQYADSSQTKDGWVTTADGVRIHYIEGGHVGTSGNVDVGGEAPAGAAAIDNVSISDLPRAPSILFVPGWTMPAWIWQKQIDYFDPKYHVVAMDPRCQGESSQAADGLHPAAMARDIKAVIDQLHLAPVVVVAWSMAVVETMSYVDQFGTRDLRGLVLVDEIAGGLSSGEAEQDLALLKSILEDRKASADAFVRKVQFHKPQPEEYIERVIQASLGVPTSAAVTLLVGRDAADYRPVLSRIDKPTLVCAAKSAFIDRVVDMQEQIQGSRLEVFEGAGHALFVDNADQFNTALDGFLRNLK